MNSQNDSAKLTGGNDSELEMVGTMLFGSITDESAEQRSKSESWFTHRTGNEPSVGRFGAGNGFEFFERSVDFIIQ